MTERPALLLVDLQEDFLARPGLTPDRATLVATIAAMLASARKKSWPVFHVRTLVDPDLGNAMPHRAPPATAEVVVGTPGAACPPELAERDGEPLFIKRFFSAFDAPGLAEALAERGVTEIVIAGVHAHACIAATALDAYARGFKVISADGLTGDYDSAHGAQALGWLDGRAHRRVPLDRLSPLSKPIVWQKRDPRDWSRVLSEVELMPAAAVAAAARELASRHATPDLAERKARLETLRAALDCDRNGWALRIVDEVAKPIADADAEVTYGLALLDEVIATLDDREHADGHVRHYRPHGLAAIITPWNNPFAISLGKLAPALGFGNAVLWKPALHASGFAAALVASLHEVGFSETLALVTGDSGTGNALITSPEVAMVAFTGSAAVGHAIIRRAAVRSSPIPVQAELGGSNAAIVDASADLDHAAADLAAAMFSFSGQRCTAIRRLIVAEAIADAFTQRLVAAVEGLRIGDPVERATQIGPLIARERKLALLTAVADAVAGGARLLTDGRIPADVDPGGCWMAPTLLDRIDEDHILRRDEWFGPIATITRFASFDEAIARHNATDFGLLGALYSTDEVAIAAFSASAQAGMLSINRARPRFSPAGPFSGWKNSGFGLAEHGRWNRDAYTRPQAIFRD